MRFPYQSSFLIGAPPPSLPPGTTFHWRPFVPITVFDPNQSVRRRFTRALLDTGADQTVFPQTVLSGLGLKTFLRQVKILSGVALLMRWHMRPFSLCCRTDLNNGYGERSLAFHQRHCPTLFLGRLGCWSILICSFVAIVAPWMLRKTPASLPERASRQRTSSNTLHSDGSSQKGNSGPTLNVCSPSSSSRTA